MSRRREPLEPLQITRAVPRPPQRPTLPSVYVQHPHCGACYQETDWDGDTFYCDRCGLDYADGREDVPATYRDPEVLPCAKPCDSTWHKPSGEWDCRTCSLPTGHQSDCWCDCQVVMP